MSGVEVVGHDAYARVIRCPDGRPQIVRFRLDGTSRARSVRMSTSSPVEKRVLRELANHLFGLDLDVTSAEAVLAEDPILAPIVARQQGARIPGTGDPFELAVRAVLGQQLSVARAAQLASAVAETWGEAVPDPQPGLTHAFPGPEALINADLSGMGLPAARQKAITVLAQRLLDAELTLDRTRPLRETTDALLAVPGIGPWTCAYVALRALGDLDSIPTQDLGLRTAISDNSVPATQRQLAARAEAWRPWRGLAAVHLWTTLLPDFSDRNRR